MKENRIRKLTTLAETRFLSLYDAQYENKKAKEKHWIIASRKDPKTLNAQFFEGKEEKIDAVIIAALHMESKSLVLIRQFRIPLNDYVYELPAGLVDGDEGMEYAVNRELHEETGLKLIDININKTQSGIYISAGMTDESVAMVFCTCEGIVTKEYLEEDEDIEPILVSKEEAKELLEKNIKMDIKAYLMLQTFAQFGEDAFK